jgi:hypothetical protein
MSGRLSLFGAVLAFLLICSPNGGTIALHNISKKFATSRPHTLRYWLTSLIQQPLPDRC